MMLIVYDVAPLVCQLHVDAATAEVTGFQLACSGWARPGSPSVVHDVGWGHAKD